MATGRTEHYGLSTLAQGDSFADAGYKYTGADRVLQDRLLWLGAEGHQHTGQASNILGPALGPSLALSTTEGTIPSGTRVYYAYSLIDGQGFESSPSPTAFIDTPAGVQSPAAPTLTYATTGGTLVPGGYYYILSAYTVVNSQETAALYAAFISIPTGASATSTNTITVTMPALPAGATGWNVYRRKPSSSKFLYLRSVVPPQTAWVDTGAVAEDCDRTQPTSNTTVSNNKITVTVPPLPAGTVAWRLYRTYVANSWDSSKLTTISGATPALSYVDVGNASVLGAPADRDQSVGAPTKILLTDAAEVQGRLAPGNVSAYPDTREFEFGGPLQVHQGSGTWVCEHPQATIKGVRAVLGRGYAPAATDVIVDVNVRVASAATPAYSSIFASLNQQPRVLVGQQIGARVVPTMITELHVGDAVTVDIDQTGGGATPTDYDLTVILYIWAYGYGLISHTWAA